MSQTLDSNSLTHLLATAQGQWTGLVNVPVGPTGFGLGFGATAGTHINQGETTPGTPAKTDGGTGLGQRSLDDQRLLGNANFIDELPFGSEQIATFSITSTDQFWVDRDAAFATDGHAVEAELDAILVTEVQHETITKMAGHETVKSKVSDNGALINNGSLVGIPNLDLSLQSTPPGGNGSISDLEVFDLQKLSLLSLQPGTNLFQVPELQGIQVLPIVNVAAPLGQSKDQQNQSTLQHSLSFGTLTLPPDRDVVNQSASFGTGFVGLTADQLALLNQATITLADLADGYLALTLGTTITLDTDAAGYGWFIDPTPFTHEEFVSGSSIVNGHSSIGSDSSPWQLQAAPGSAADGKMDLMTEKNYGVIA